jgi:hypothetical protein
MAWRWSAAVAMRERRRGVVVEDDLLPGELAEADEEVLALSRAGDEAAAERIGIKGLVRGDEHRVVYRYSPMNTKVVPTLLGVKASGII